MRARVASLVLLPLLAALVAVPAGCSRKQERWFLSLDVGGPPGGPSKRQVSASIEGHAGDLHKIDQRDDAVVITFVGGELVVEKSRITLDGKEVAKVPGNADGAVVLEMPLGK
jgi:hypothetical protein